MPRNSPYKSAPEIYRLLATNDYPKDIKPIHHAVMVRMKDLTPAQQDDYMDVYGRDGRFFAYHHGYGIADTRNKTFQQTHEDDTGNAPIQQERRKNPVEVDFENVSIVLGVHDWDIENS